MAFDGPTGYASRSLSWSASKNGPSSGISFPPITNGNTVTRKTAYVLGGNAAGGANEVACFIQAIAASGSATINLQSLTDILANTGIVLVRLKAFWFWLLSTADDSINGTACSGVTIGNAASNANLLNMGGTTPTYTLGNGEEWGWSSGLAAGLAVDASHLNVKIANSDSVNGAAVLCGFVGATT